MHDIAALAAEIDRRMAEEIPEDAPDGAVTEWIVANYGHLPVSVFAAIVEYQHLDDTLEADPTPAQIEAMQEACALLKQRGLADDPGGNFWDALQKIADEGDEQARHLLEVIGEIEFIPVKVLDA